VYGNSTATAASRPFFGSFEQYPSNPARADLLVDNKPANLSATIYFDSPEDVCSDPTSDLASRKPSNIDGALVRVLHFGDPHSDLFTRAWIAKLSRQIGHSVVVARFRWANCAHGPR
jgi:hypothetical protein